MSRGTAAAPLRPRVSEPATHLARGCIPDEQLVPLTTGTPLPQAISEHLVTCTRCPTRIEELGAEAAAIAQTHVPGPAALPLPNAPLPAALEDVSALVQTVRRSPDEDAEACRGPQRLPRGPDQRALALHQR